MKIDYKGLDIVIIGAGANGSHFLRNMLQDLSNYAGKLNNIRVLIADADKVELKNTKNQLFDESDIGTEKVYALAERYGLHYRVDVLAVAEYITDIDKLIQLFANDHRQKVLIGAVDNNRTRQLMHEYFNHVDDLIYIDMGVEGVLVREELKAIEDHLEREKMIIGSGLSGQVVVGYKHQGQIFIPPICDVYPTILGDEESVFPTQTCAETINNPQRLITNRMCADYANIILNNLFHTKEIHQQEIKFNSRFGIAGVTYVPKRIEQAYLSFTQEKKELLEAN